MDIVTWLLDCVVWALVKGLLSLRSTFGRPKSQQARMENHSFFFYQRFQKAMLWSTLVDVVEVHE